MHIAGHIYCWFGFDVFILVGFLKVLNLGYLKLEDCHTGCYKSAVQYDEATNDIKLLISIQNFIKTRRLSAGINGEEPNLYRGVTKILTEDLEIFSD